MPVEIVSNEAAIRDIPVLDHGVLSSSIVTLIGYIVTNKITSINPLFGATLMGSATVASHFANSLFRNTTYRQFFEKAFFLCTLPISAYILKISVLNTLLISSISVIVYAAIHAIYRAL